MRPSNSKMAASKAQNKSSLEKYFQPFRENIIGYNETFPTPYGEKRMIYTDWTASGRLYGPIEAKLSQQMGVFVANTHTETTVTGTAMTLAYNKAKSIIKEHVGADGDDALIMAGSGMTGAVNKFQRILGLKICEKLQKYTNVPDSERPVVFVTHKEHHSNHTSWLETIAHVERIEPTKDGFVDLNYLEILLDKYKDRRVKIAAITSCSNVTGLQTPYHQVAKIMHQHNGWCFVDFACSGPYIDINMHPKDEQEKLDAIYFSPHKFLGGPGTSGVLIFDKQLYSNKIPDHPGGGTVAWTNPWGDRQYFDDIEAREDGGTPPFLQTIKTALCVQLKDKMGVENILQREHELLEKIFLALKPIRNLHILAEQHEDRLGVVSFYIEDLHYNLGVKLLNDHFGVQTRGGCACAGTYGHYLLDIDLQTSKSITDVIDAGDLSVKPGWIRFSIHPTMTDEEMDYALAAIQNVAANHLEMAKDYDYCSRHNEFKHRMGSDFEKNLVEEWFRNE